MLLPSICPGHLLLSSLLSSPALRWRDGRSRGELAGRLRPGLKSSGSYLLHDLAAEVFLFSSAGLLSAETPAHTQLHKPSYSQKAEEDRHLSGQPEMTLKCKNMSLEIKDKIICMNMFHDPHVWV